MCSIGQDDFLLIVISQTATLSLKINAVLMIHPRLLRLFAGRNSHARAAKAVLILPLVESDPTPCQLDESYRIVPLEWSPRKITYPASYRAPLPC